jgi:hypothetical protein
MLKAVKDKIVEFGKAYKVWLYIKKIKLNNLLVLTFLYHRNHVICNYRFMFIE